MLSYIFLGIIVSALFSVGICCFLKFVFFYELVSSIWSFDKVRLDTNFLLLVVWFMVVLCISISWLFLFNVILNLIICAFS